MYNDAQVKNELRKIFLKCAYCESSYDAVYDGDIEHFRPKGKVKEKTPQTPGYYWLANDWDNLFIACQHCNQRRKHVLYGEDVLQGYGKLDQFPVKTEAKRLKNHKGKLANEEKVRLLVNPCKDEPSEHFAYEPLEAVIVPLTDMGKATVEVCVLQRPNLVRERKKQLLLLFKQMERVKRELERLNTDNSATQRAVFNDEFETLLAYTDPVKPESNYAGMCRFFVKKFMQENGLT